jgi:hypothetical protein
MTRAAPYPRRRFRGAVVIVALCTVLSLKASVAWGQSGTIGYPLSNGQVAGITAGIAAIGVGIGVGVFLIVRHNHMLTGCTASTTSSLILQTDGSGQHYDLLGSVADIKPGVNVRLSGKKGKDAGGDRTFLVEKLSKNLGPCKTVSSTP